MAFNYNIDSELIDKFKSTISSNQIITEIENTRNKYIINDIGPALNFSDSYDFDKPLVKIFQVNSTDPLTRFIPTEILVEKFKGFTSNQISILNDINEVVKLVNKQIEEEKERERIKKQEESAKIYELNIEAAKAAALQRELELKSRKEREEQKQENYKLVKSLITEVGTDSEKQKFDTLTPHNELAVAALLEKLNKRKIQKQEKEARRENAYRLEAIDDLDEDNKRVPISQWFVLYNKAINDGAVRDLYESRAIIVNSTLHCNAARALIYHEVGSIDKQTGEYTGKEGNKLYNICDTGDEWAGLYARYATPNEIDTYVTRLFGEEWTNLLNE